MTRLKILKEKKMEILRASVPKNLGRYQSKSPKWEEILGPEDNAYVTHVEVQDNYSRCFGDDDFSAVLTERGRRGEERTKFMKQEPARCEAIFDALKLTPQQAADERIWVYLTHFVFWNYSRARWPLPDDNDEKKIQSVDAHFFVPSLRGMVRDNAISRLWWMAHICTGLDHNRRDALDALLLQEDARKEVIERASFCRSKRVFNSIMKFMILSCKGNQQLHERLNFRKFTVCLNRIGGIRVLEAMPKNKLEDEIRKIIKKDLGLNPEFPSSG